MSLGYANLAKLAYHRLDFEKGYYYNTEAYKCLSLSYDEAVEQALPIATSIKLFLAEYKRLSAENYLFGKEYQKAESELKVAAAIYDEVVFRDR